MNNWKINSEFIDSIKEISYKMQDKYNIPALLLMSIAALETGWGKEKQSVDHNNFFNAKWHKQEKFKKYIHKTIEFDKEQNSIEVYDSFINFDSVEEGFEYICNRIMNNLIYYKTRNAIYFYKDNLNNSFFCSIIALYLNQDGYSTKESWHCQIIDIIDRISKQYKNFN
jgi:flagellum-specific peptidoglycan hydrolase FlgJ